MSRERVNQRRRDEGESSGGGAWGIVTGAGIFIASLIGGGVAWQEHQGRLAQSEDAAFERYCADLTPSNQEFMRCPD